MDFRDLDELIHSGAKLIVLDSDVALGEDEESEYNGGIRLDVDKIIIDGNDHVIDARSLTGIFDVTKAVKIKNVTLKNGNSRGGGAIFNKSDLSLVNVKFLNNESESDGGAIMNKGSLKIKRCIFKGNTSINGGAIYTIENSSERDLFIFESKFEDNSAVSDGGAVYVEGHYNFRSDKFTVNTIVNSDFTNNSAGGGGAIDSGAGLILRNNKFKENSSRRDGGAILVDSRIYVDVDLFMSSCTFIENYSENGGAIFFRGDKLTLQYGDFRDNHAECDGGAILYGHRGEKILTLRDTNFSNNSSKGDGGALFCLGSDAEVHSCKFTSNSSHRGGAIYKAGNPIKLYNTNFVKNEADEGTAVFGHVTSFNSNLFKTNDGEYRDSEEDEQLLNKIETLIRKKSSEINLTSNLILNDNDSFDGFRLDYDRVVIDGNNNTIDVGNAECVFKVCAEYVTIKNINFTNANSKDRSLGFIRIEKDAFCSLENCSFNNNSSLTINNEGQLWINRSLFKDNGIKSIENIGEHAADHAGFTDSCAEDPALILNNGDLLIAYGRFQGNFGTILAGGVTSFDHCEFHRCICKYSIIHSDKGNLDISYSSFEQNNSGSIAQAGDDNLRIEGCKFINNVVSSSLISDISAESDIGSNFFENNYSDKGELIVSDSFDNLGNMDSKDLFDEDRIHGEDRYDFNYLNRLIHESESNKIVLNHDISLHDYEEGTYEKGIRIDEDGLVIDGNGYAIDAGNKSAILNIFSKDLTFENLIFRNGFADGGGGAVKINPFASCNFNNCCFENNAAGECGGAIENHGGLKLVRNRFENNSSPKGGAIYNSSENVEMHESSFIDNGGSEKGHSIYTETSSSLKIRGCDFSKIRSDEIYAPDPETIEFMFCRFGGVSQEESFRYLDNLIRSGNEIIELDKHIRLDDDEEPDYAEGILIDRDDLVICGNGLVIDANSKSRIFNIRNSNVTLNNIIFKNGHSDDAGGAIKIDKDSSVKMQNVKFIDNDSGYGGAIMNDGNLSVERTSFEKNTAEESGGAIANENDLEIENSDFIENYAGNVGDSINNLARISVHDCRFDGSRPSEISEGPESSSMISSDFKDRGLPGEYLTKLMEGGAKEITLPYDFCKYYEEDAICIVDNDITIDGDGHEISNIPFSIKGKNVTLKNISFIGFSRIPDYPPLIWNEEGSDLNIINCKFINNKDVIFNYGKIKIAESEFINNGYVISNQGDLEISNSTFRNNSHHTLIDNWGPMEIRKCDFSKNRLNYKDEYAAIRNNHLLNLSYSNFNGNHSPMPLIFNRKDAILNINDGKFNGNQLQGHAILNEGNANFIKLKFDGGSILNESELTLKDILIENEGKPIINVGNIFVKRSSKALLEMISRGGKVVTDEIPKESKGDFSYLDRLIHSGRDGSEIMLDCDISLKNYEIDFYEGGIELDIDNLVIDGNFRKISGNGEARIFLVTAKNITLKNIVFEEGLFYRTREQLLNADGKLIKINADCDLKLVDCKFLNSNSSYGEHDIYPLEDYVVEYSPRPPSTPKKESFTHLNGLIHGNQNRIKLKNDIELSPEEDLFPDGIEIDVDDLIIFGEGHVVDAQGKNRIFNVSGRNVKIMNMVLCNGHCEDGGGAIRNSGELTLENVSFKANSSDGEFGDDIFNEGELVLRGDDFSFSKSKSILNCGSVSSNDDVMLEAVCSDKGFDFVSDLVHSGEKEILLDWDIICSGKDHAVHGIRIDVDDLTIDGQNHIVDAQEMGRIFRVTGKNITLKNMVLCNGHCEDGGGAIRNSGELTLENVSFKANSSDGEFGDDIFNEGELVLRGDDFSFSKAKSILNRGTAFSNDDVMLEAIRSERGFDFVSDLVHSDEKEILLDWDVICSGRDRAVNGITIDVDDLTIDGQNHIVDAQEMGRIFRVTGKNITLKNMTLQNANAEKGGAICNSGDLKVENLIMQNNWADHGGGIYNSAGGTLAIDGCVFESNRANHGGGLANHKAKAFICDCKFIKNKVSGKATEGGAISNVKAELLMKGTALQKNEAYDGGAIYSSEGKLYITKSVLSNNRSSRFGGAIFNNKLGRLRIEESAIKDNTAMRGKAICSYFTFECDNCTFDDDIYYPCGPEPEEGDYNAHDEEMSVEGNNSTLNECKNFKYLDELIHSGVGEIILDSDIVLDEGEEFEYLEGIKLDVDSILIDGKGHSIDACGKTRMLECTARNVQIKNLEFKNGFSWKGGAVFVHDEASCMFENCRIMKNRSIYGGAVYVHDGTVKLSDSNFKSNSAGRGAALTNYKGTVEVKSTVFSKNKSDMSELDKSCGYGGAINNGYGEIIIYDSRMAENFAEYDGGAVTNYGGKIRMENTSMYKNYANDGGGAIHNYVGAKTILINCTLSDNSSGIRGGGILNNKDGKLIIDNSSIENNSPNDVYRMNDM